MLAAGLLRLDAPVEVTVVERSGRLGHGLAYRTESASHLLNVPAGRMGAWPDDEEHFLRWLRESRPETKGGDFVARGVYGAYLRDLIDRGEFGASRARLVRVTGEAVGVREGGVTLADGRVLPFDALVLATGNAPPPPPPVEDRAVWTSDLCVSDPWGAGALDVIGKRERVLLVGTGLTMLDTALHLRDAGHKGELVAVSRRGLMPQAHRASSSKPHHGDPPGSVDGWVRSGASLVREVRRFVREGESRGVDWRESVTALRSVTARLWGGLDARSRASVLRHARAYWEVHRHRAAPEVARAVEAMRDSGHLRVVAARLLSVREEGDSVDVSMRLREGGEVTYQRFDRVVNCTGPDTDCLRAGALFRSLAERGLVVQDAHRLGLQSDESGAAIGADGAPSERLWLLGGLRRARLWESTAVPELRGQAWALAQRLAASA